MVKKFCSACIIILFFICFFTFCVFSGEAVAANNVLGLYADTDYDIYLKGQSEDMAVIQNVKIVDFKEIRGMVFLVIQGEKFDIKESTGLVLFESINAVLPSNRLTKVKNVQKLILR